LQRQEAEPALEDLEEGQLNLERVLAGVRARVIDDARCELAQLGNKLLVRLNRAERRLPGLARGSQSGAQAVVVDGHDTHDFRYLDAAPGLARHATRVH